VSPLRPGHGLLLWLGVPAQALHGVTFATLWTAAVDKVRGCYSSNSAERRTGLVVVDWLAGWLPGWLTFDSRERDILPVVGCTSRSLTSILKDVLYTTHRAAVVCMYFIRTYTSTMVAMDLLHCQRRL
jgi:hypothetical protein